MVIGLACGTLAKQIDTSGHTVEQHHGHDQADDFRKRKLIERSDALGTRIRSAHTRQFLDQLIVRVFTHPVIGGRNLTVRRPISGVGM